MRYLGPSKLTKNVYSLVSGQRSLNHKKIILKIAARFSNIKHFY